MIRTASRIASDIGARVRLGADAGLGRADPRQDQAGRQIVCGVNTGLAGFGQPDSQGRYSGFDIDICKAIAAAVLGDPEKVKYVPLTAQQRFTALQSGEIDLLSRNTTLTLQRDAELGLNFAPVVFYDGQGFMVPKKLGVKSAKELNGATDLRAAGHDDRTQPGRLFPRQQHAVQAARHRKARRGRFRLSVRALRRDHDRPFRARPGSAPGGRRTRTTT